MARIRNFPWAFLVKLLMALGWLGLAGWRYFDEDEFQHIHIAWLISRGVLPFRDFFEHHVPFYHLLLSPLLRLPEGPWLIFLFRAISLLCAGATLVVIYRFGKRQDGTWPALGATWLLAWVPMFAGKMTEARPEAPAILTFTLAVLGLLETEARPPGYGKSFLVGLLAGLTVLFSGKYIFPVFGLVLVFLFTQSAAAILLLFLGAASSCLPLIVYLALNRLFPEFLRLALINNIFWRHRFSPQGYLFEAFATAAGLAGLALAGVLAGFLEKPERSLVLVGALGGSLLGIFVIPEPYRQTFLPLFPALAIAASLTLSLFLKSFPQQGLALVVMVLAGSLPGLVRLWSGDVHGNRKDLATMALVEKVDPGRGPVFDGRGLMFYRPHVGFHACMHRGIMAMIDPGRYAGETIRELQRLNYPVVIFDYRVKEMPVELQDFIKMHYQPVGNTEVYMPGLSIDRSLLAMEGSDVEIPIAGEYQISWVGQELMIDGQVVANNSVISLSTGNHHFQGLGFVDRLSLILVRRRR
ncbi:MAG TPA: glycosyltransferase family 39 protein [bacterium]|nr:glycosyltransferase family 39 protein [bacterium]HOL66784.1 glycosyltransferase family 39 protein [bacterium]HPP12282.1 glycosyltransferase family 39 protein [bacterium]